MCTCVSVCIALYTCTSVSKLAYSVCTVYVQCIYINSRVSHCLHIWLIDTNQEAISYHWICPLGKLSQYKAHTHLSSKLHNVSALLHTPYTTHTYTHSLTLSLSLSHSLSPSPSLSLSHTHTHTQVHQVFMTDFISITCNICVLT